MIEPVRITDPEQIESIEGLLHDQILDLDGLRHEPEKGVLEIKLLLDDDRDLELLSNSWCRRYYKLPLRRGVLRIGHVVTYRVDDRGQIGRYTINTVLWNQQDSTLTIKACEHMEIYAHVTAIDVELYGSDEIIGHREFTELFRFIYWYGPSVLHSQC